jgi:RNA polymerase sigma-32 factor
MQIPVLRLGSGVLQCGSREGVSSVAATFDAGIARYLREVHRIPLLTNAEERALAKQWRDHRDLAAMQRLVSSHLRLVVKIALQYRGYGRPIDELIAEGNLGMVQAAKRFDPDRGFRLATYAICWIRAAIMEYVLRTSSIVKMGTTAAQRKLFFKLGPTKKRLLAIDGGDLPSEVVKQIALELGVREVDVVCMNRRLVMPDYSLDRVVDDASGSSTDWHTMLADGRVDRETAVAMHTSIRYRQELLRKALTRLDAREREIVVQRRLRDKRATLSELSIRYSVSCERVRQIEHRAVEKIRRAIYTAMISATARNIGDKLSRSGEVLQRDRA